MTLKRQLLKAWAFHRRAKLSFREMIDTISWMNRSQLSPEGHRAARNGLLLMLVAMCAEQSVPLLFGFLVEAKSNDVPVAVLIWYLTGMVGLMIAGIALLRLSNNQIEWAWNCHERAIRTNATSAYLARVPEEILAEDRDVGPNQIESCANHMHMIMRTLNFEVTSITATLSVAICFVTYVDLAAGAILIATILGNMIFIFYMNHYIHRKMVSVDRRWRRFHNQQVEFWQEAVYVIASGLRHEVVAWTKKTTTPILWDDFLVWGRWYQIVDGVRSVLTTLAIAVILVRALHWEVGYLVSLFSWAAIYRDQFWKMAHAQRELTEHTSRLHPFRKLLNTPSSFQSGVGEPYPATT